MHNISLESLNCSPLNIASYWEPSGEGSAPLEPFSGAAKRRLKTEESLLQSWPSCFHNHPFDAQLIMHMVYLQMVLFAKSPKLLEIESQ